MLYGIWNEQYWRFFVKTVPVFIKMSGVRQLEHKQNEGSLGDRKSILFRQGNQGTKSWDLDIHRFVGR